MKNFNMDLEIFGVCYIHSMLIRKGIKFQLGQGVRMLLHYTNTKYEDTVYSIKNVNEWQAAKANNAWDLDFPNLPYYIDGNVKLTQSNAILRHIGRQHSLYGSNDDQSSEIDMLLDTIKDIKMGIIVPNVFLRILVSRKKILHFLLRIVWK